MSSIVQNLAQPRVLASGWLGTSITGATAETTLASIAIPGGLMGPHGCLRGRVLYQMSNNANAKTVNVRLGGASGALMAASTIVSTGVAEIVFTIYNQGAQNAQTSFRTDNPGIPGTPLFGSHGGTIDTSVTQALVVTGALGVTTDTIILSAWTIEVIPGVPTP